MNAINSFKLMQESPSKSKKSAKNKVIMKNFGAIKFHDIFLDESACDTLSVTIKNYSTKEGLSKRISEEKV